VNILKDKNSKFIVLCIFAVIILTQTNLAFAQQNPGNSTSASDSGSLDLPSGGGTTQTDGSNEPSLFPDTGPSTTNSQPNPDTTAQAQQMQQNQTLQQNMNANPVSAGAIQEHICVGSTCKYTLLAPIGNLLGEGGIYTITQNTNGLCSLFNTWFRVGIALAGLFAVVMIVLGGIEYATTDSLFNKSEGKSKVENAVFGLLLALTTWLIINTINPALTNCNLNATSVELEALTIEKQNSIITSLAMQNSDGAPGFNYSNSQQLSETPDGGLSYNTTRVRIDSDGITAPPYYDATRQWETSYQPGGKSLDATKQAFVVVPMDRNGQASIPMGTPVLIQNNTTGKQIWGVAGDVGPSANGYGEMSLYAAKQIGATSGTSDSAYENQDVKITFYPKKK
jgi:hypothetical protein